MYKIIAVKIAQEELITGMLRDMQKILSNVKDAYELCDVVYGPGEFLLFELQVIQ